MSAIPFFVVAKGEPGKAGGGDYTFHPALLPRSNGSESEVMEHMESHFGIHRSDYKRFAAALQETILHLLKFHNHIDLGDIGYVDLAIRSRGESDPDKVTVRNIEKPTLHLRFSQDMKLGVSRLKFAKADADELRRAGVSHAERRG
jgi:hypothetical protein